MTPWFITMNAFLTVKEAAARGRVSERLVRGWLRDGLLPHFRLGAKGRRGKIAIAVEDLERLLASFRVEPTSTPTAKPAPALRRPELKHLRFT